MKTKLPTEVRIAISDKIQILFDLNAINPSDKNEVRKRFETSILDEPTRDPYIIIDQIARTYIDKRYDK